MKKIENTYINGKKSLETLLREKAYSNVKKNLEDKEIDINEVSDEDMESLVGSKVQDMKSGIKGFSIGAVLTAAISLVIGV
jgi:hypothetical protein